MSAEGSTRKGALPPNSIEVRSTCSEAWASRVRPTPVDPVKETFRSRASAIRVELRALESEVTTQLTTPRGRPASARIDIRARDVSGVRSEEHTSELQSRGHL